MRFTVRKGSVLCILALGLGLTVPSFANEIILTGTDAITFHDDVSYGSELFKDLSGGGSGNILVLSDGSDNSSNLAFTGASNFVFTTSLTGITLSNYAGLFVATPGKCCGDPSSEIAGFESQILSYVQGGGNLAVEDFLGSGACVTAGGTPGDWSKILGFDPTAGLIGTGCNDATQLNIATATTAGSLKGYTDQNLGTSKDVFDHQIYSTSFFAGKGYSTLLYADSSTSNESVVLEGTLGSNSPTVPEPSSLAGLVGIALTGLAVFRRQRVR